MGGGYEASRGGDQGLQTRETLTKWNPADYETFMVANILVAKHRMWGTSLPCDFEEGRQRYAMDPE